MAVGIAVVFRKILYLFVPSMTPERPIFVGTPFGDNMRRLYSDAESAWMANESLSQRWTRLHYLFGLGTVILAAAAGFGGLGALFTQRTAAWVALAAAVVAAISTFLNTDEQRKRHDELAVAWNNFRKEVDNVYSFAPGAAERIQYSREYEASGTWKERRHAHIAGNTRERPNLVMPPDPEGWQMYVEQLQERANALRRGKTIRARPWVSGHGQTIASRAARHRTTHCLGGCYLVSYNLLVPKSTTIRVARE